MENFFLAAGTAGMETLHSATIAWLLSDESDAYSIDTRSNILHKIFETDSLVIYDRIITVTECEHIDIFIIAFKGNDISFYAIENKIKSTQHDCQLEKYNNALKDIENKFSNCKIVGRCLLSLTGEEPESENWRILTYKKLSQILACPDGENEQNQKIADDYINTVKCICDLQDKIKTSNSRDLLKYIFENGSTTKADKAFEKIGNIIYNKHEDRDIDLIKSINLETLFQKWYIQEIIHPDIKRIIAKHESILPEIEINESRGNTNISITLYGEKGGEYWIELSIQNGSFKFAVSSFYLNKSVKLEDSEIERLDLEYSKGGTLYEYLNKLKSESEFFTRIQTGGKGNYRISISHPFGEVIYYDGNFRETFEHYFAESIKSRDEILNYLKGGKYGREK